MGLLLKAGIDLDLIKSALIAFSTISISILIINYLPFLKKFIPNHTLQLGGLIGNTSFLGIPIAIALLPTDTINFTIGFDLGTTLFAWIFGPFLLKKDKSLNNFLNLQNLLFSVLNSPASRGIIGVLIIYILGLEDILRDYLWIPAKLVIMIAIIIVGARLGIISNSGRYVFQIDKEIISSILLKLVFLPLIIFGVINLIDLDRNQTISLLLQAGTPSAISTILMAEAFKNNQDLAANILFSTTILSIITISIFSIFIQ